MAAPSTPRRSGAWRVEAFFSNKKCGALILWSLQVAIYLCKHRIPNDRVLHSRTTNQLQCNGPYNTATCYLHTAMWLEKVHPF